jgi:hypothetical protein
VLEKQRVQPETIAAAVCISEDRGLEGYLLRPYSIKSDDLVDLLEYIRKKNKTSKIALFMDNLKAHYS